MKVILEVADLDSQSNLADSLRKSLKSNTKISAMLDSTGSDESRYFVVIEKVETPRFIDRRNHIEGAIAYSMLPKNNHEQMERERISIHGEITRGINVDLRSKIDRLLETNVYLEENLRKTREENNLLKKGFSEEVIELRRQLFYAEEKISEHGNYINKLKEEIFDLISGGIR
jgi:hypothetical protein